MGTEIWSMEDTALAANDLPLSFRSPREQQHIAFLACSLFQGHLDTCPGAESLEKHTGNEEIQAPHPALAKDYKY